MRTIVKASAIMLITLSMMAQAVSPLTFSLNRLENGKVKTVTESSWADKHLLIAVGYTGCPDICPTTLLDIRNALKALDSKPDTAAMIQPLFITIDPLSDSLSAISRYAAYFDSRIIGLRTDDFERLNHVTKQLRASYGYLYEGKPVNPPNLPKGYTVMHSVYIYLYAPDGSLIDAYPYNLDGKEMARRIEQSLVK